MSVVISRIAKHLPKLEVSWSLLIGAYSAAFVKNSRSCVTLFSFTMKAEGWAEPGRWSDHRNTQLTALLRSVLHTFSRTIPCLLSFSSACQRSLRGWAQPTRWSYPQNTQSLAARKSVLSWSLRIRASSTAFAKTQGRSIPRSASRWKPEVGQSPEGGVTTRKCSWKLLVGACCTHFQR